MRAIAKMANVVTVRQQEPLGLGHAVLCAKALVGDEPFIVMLGDDIIDAAVPAAKQLASCFERNGLGTIALMEVSPAETHMYGIAAGPALDARTIRIEKLVEKPKKDAPVQPGGDRPLRAAAAHLLDPGAGEAGRGRARSSSPTRWPCWPARRGCSATGSRGSATTPATASASSRPTSPSRSSAPTSGSR